MKKRFLALACVLTLTLSLGLTASAAQSPSAGSSSGSSSPSASGSSKPSTPASQPSSGSSSHRSSGSGEVAVTAGGQVITDSALVSFVDNASFATDVAGAYIRTVAGPSAAKLVNAANQLVGANAAIISMVDIVVPSGTGTASFTLGVQGLVAGQSVTVLHLRSDGQVETLPVTAVGNGAVTFTMSSYSPVAVVINATAPKTADMNTTALLFLALMGVMGAAICGKKYAGN